EGGRIDHDARRSQRDVRAVERGSVHLVTLITNQHRSVVRSVLVNVNAHRVVQRANELGVGRSFEDAFGRAGERRSRCRLQNGQSGRRNNAPVTGATARAGGDQVRLTVDQDGQSGVDIADVGRGAGRSRLV